jgi:hypothetical protein
MYTHAKERTYTYARYTHIFLQIKEGLNVVGIKGLGRGDHVQQIVASEKRFIRIL